jgi:hypothetical protein
MLFDSFTGDAVDAIKKFRKQGPLMDAKKLLKAPDSKKTVKRLK